MDQLPRINDISGFQTVSETQAKGLERVHLGLAQMGMRRAIRVVGKAALTALQFTKTGSRAGYISDVAASVSEAEKMLNSGK